MSDSPLIPERQHAFSPGLAATIGLEEAILLQHLGQLLADGATAGTLSQRGGFNWLRVSRTILEHQLPYWTVEDLQRISRALVDKGILLVESPPLHATTELIFALNEPASRTGHQREARETVVASPQASSPRSAGILPATWSPSEDLLQLLALNHNIPRQFALDQLEDFVFYWRERGETRHAWENTFRQTVISQWRRQQQQEAEEFLSNKPKPLDNHWRPNADAMEIMDRAGIDQGFIEQAIPEFVLYWRERGAAPKELNSKFVQHIRIQWAKYTSSLEHSTEPKRITDQWQPSEDVIDILRLSHIDIEYARSLLPEFIVYWKDSNQANTSWNSKFLQHVKHHWAKHHHLPQANQSNAGHQGSSHSGRTRDRSLEQDLSDTSWAD